MNRAHQSQVREVLIQLVELRNRLNVTFWDEGAEISIHNEIKIKEALTELNNAIRDLTEVI